MPVFRTLLKDIIYIFCFILSMQAMRAFDFERFLKKGHVKEAQVLYFLLVMSLAWLSGSFVAVFLGL